jgi:fructose-bisphosphate aldolase class II
MLTSIRALLQRARQEHFAVPLFNVFDLQGAEGMFEAAEAANAPVIVGIYSQLLARPNAHAFAAYMRQRAQDAAIPAAVMLDHGASFEQCMLAIKYGFTDVMYDGSRLSLEENIANTQAVVRAAHAVEVAVEAELGHVGSASDAHYRDDAVQRKGFTDPAMAERFVAETGVDFLAVAIGNAHGQYNGEPFIDQALLMDIQRRVPIPLSLHGGSGITEDQFRAAIGSGIAKINIATDIYVATARRIEQISADPKVTYFDLIPLVAQTFNERCAYFFDLFGAAGKAV